MAHMVKRETVDAARAEYGDDLAMGQSAPGSGSSTVLVGLSSLALSPINSTPHSKMCIRDR